MRFPWTKDKQVTSKTTKASYKIVIKEKFGSATTTLKTITASRYIDEDDHVVYLRNKEEKFLELKPQDENDFIKLNEKELKTRLDKTRDKLKKEQEVDDADINIKNLEFQVMKLEAKLRAVHYGSDSAYETLDQDGTKKYYFLREGSTFHPFKWDTDTKTVYTASDNKKKKAGIARRNKQIKYSKFKNTIEAGTLLMMILIFCVGVGEAYIGFKMFSKFDESAIVEAQNFCVQKGAEWTQIVQKNAQATSDILDKLKEQQSLVRPGIIQDFIPTRE